jgi:hypothetical protein
MDPFAQSLGADSPPTAADPQGFPAGADPSQGLAPDQTGAPVAAETPPSTGEPQVPAPPEIDYRAALEALAPQLQRAQQLEQTFAELQRQAALAQQAQAEQAARERATSQRDQIYRMAEQLPPEDAIAFIRRGEDQIVAEYEARVNQTAEQGRAQAVQIARALAAPLYAQHLAQQHGLPPEAAEQLAMLPDPTQMDAYAPVLKRQHETAAKTVGELKRQYESVLKELDQVRRGQGAQGHIASGAHAPAGGTGVAPTAAVGEYAGSTAELGRILAAFSQG